MPAQFDQDIVAAADAATRPGDDCPQTVATLRDARTRLEMLSMDDALPAQASFDASYLGLTAATACAYRALGLSPTLEFSVEFAAAAARLGDLDRARDHAYRSLRETHAGDRRAYASALTSHALVSLVAGRVDTAITAFREVVTIQQELNLHRAEGLTLINLADSLIECGRATEAANHLNRARALKHELLLDQPWLGDPVSVWIWLVFNRYFVDGENSFAKVVLAAYDQHVANAEALRVAAEQYGLADVLHAALDDGPKLPR